MSARDVTVLDRIHKAKGFEFDLQEGFRKLISSQFGGNPARGLCELIQNAIDSYPSSVQFEDRRIDILTTHDSVCVRDRGEGMDLKRLNLLATLGGTDKYQDPNKIGRFGIGFFSVFNPRLHTSKVTVRTLCESHVVVLEFLVDPLNPEQAPALRTSVLDDARSERGTAITVHFSDPDSVGECWQEAERFLRYFPCRVKINGSAFTETVWEAARVAGARFFKEDSKHGFIRSDGLSGNLSILCKYEHIFEYSTAGLSTGGHSMTGDLDDFRRRQIPLIPMAHTVVNDNKLNVTVSRDSVMLDSNYEAMVGTVRRNYFAELTDVLKNNPNADLVVANQYILAEEIGKHLAQPASQQDPQTTAIAALAGAALYRLDGRLQPVSLEYLWQHRSAGKPLFYAILGNNVKWLGGAFDHDFVVLPPECRYFPKNSEFYDRLFGRIFEDSVNLDAVRERPDLIEKLVSRGIVPRDLLSPQCEMVSARDTTPEERRFLNEIDALLADPGIRWIIQENLHLQIRSIKTVLFDIHEKGIVVATGLFSEDGTLLDNLVPQRDRAPAPPVGTRDLKMGLMRSHSVIRHLINADDPFRAYFALTYLAHELVGCQRMLVPGSSFSNWIQGELARQMRKAVVDHLLPKAGTSSAEPETGSAEAPPDRKQP